MDAEYKKALLEELSRFETTVQKREENSLIFAHMVAHDAEPQDIELVRERTGADPTNLRIYVQPRDTARTVEQLEARIGRQRKLLLRALPKLMAHRRTVEALHDGEALAYMDELLEDAQRELEIKVFVDDGESN